MTNQIIELIAIWALPVLFAITLHEAAHGWAACRLGDNTAVFLGRLTLNPFKHIDVIGTIVVPIALLMLGGFIFGWAKPVPINIRSLKHPNRDLALIAIAGPLSNLIMAVLWAIVARSTLSLHTVLPLGVAMGFFSMGKAGVWINILLAVLNMIPIPPLDGSRIVSSLLPPRLAWNYSRIEPYGFFIILGLFALGILQNIILLPMRTLFILITQTIGIG